MIDEITNELRKVDVAKVAKQEAIWSMDINNYNVALENLNIILKIVVSNKELLERKGKCLFELK